VRVRIAICPCLGGYGEESGKEYRVGFGRLLAVGGATDGVQHDSATSKVAREAGYRLGSDRGSPNHGSTLASKRVMPQIRPPARVST
jgi:hypothetical protein